MRPGLSLSAVTAAFVLLGACGGDDRSPAGTTTDGGGAGGESPAGGAQGSGGSDGEGGAGGDGGTGGAGKQDDAGAGGQGGERGSVAGTKAIGDPCTDDDECSGGLCWSEEESGWASGYCTAFCAEELLECAPGSLCVSVSNTLALCIKACTTDADCPGTARACVPLTADRSVRGCAGGCETDDQCATACDDDTGLCSKAAEICDNDLDDDLDGLQGCEELDCSSQASCVESIAAACEAAIDISGEGMFTGSTEGGSNLFFSQCADVFGNRFPVGSGGNERIFRFVAPADGVLRFLPTAISGSFHMYLRTSCDDMASERGCLPSIGVNRTPAQINVSEGNTYYLFIDSEEGAEYSLDVNFLEPICGDGEVLSPETCDDANDDDEDLCKNDCSVNTEVECAMATPVETEVMGDTLEGVPGLTGSCGGRGPELVYQYSPTATGKVRITVTPTDNVADLLVYARSACDDATTELACDDAGFDAHPETILVDVTEAEPITIVVDTYRSSRAGPFLLTITQE